MRRNRLKNIINKSKEISNKQQLVGESPFEQFKNSLPEELESFKGDNYRLEAAWKAYGSPKNYEEAVWLGLVNPVFPNKMPSIGYNEESDEYEYLNTGKENDTVAKDIRVWDNDVIPLVKELKLGGYVRTFNEEKNCWTYSKNPQKGIEPSENNEQQVIEEFKKGGNVKDAYEKFLATLPPNQRNTDESVYRMHRYWELNDKPKDFWEALEKGMFIKESDGFYHANSVAENKETGEIEFMKAPNHKTAWMEEAAYNSSKPKLINGLLDDGNPENYTVVPMEGEEKEQMDKFRSQYNLIKTDENGNPLKYWKYVPKNPQAFKQGGQMNVIPEGALHARKNNMELANEGEVTHKGIPVVDNQGEQQAEIERNEIIFTKETTDKIEGYYKKFKDNSTSTSEKDELAIKCGKFLVEQILENTDDKTGLIEEVKQNI